MGRAGSPLPAARAATPNMGSRGSPDRPSERSPKGRISGTGDEITNSGIGGGGHCRGKWGNARGPGLARTLEGGARLVARGGGRGESGRLRVLSVARLARRGGTGAGSDAGAIQSKRSE